MKAVISDQTVQGVQKGLRVGGFKMRLFLYFCMYIPIVLLFSLLIIVSKVQLLNLSNYNISELESAFIMMSIFCVPPILPFVFTEWRIRRWRRAMGLSIYKNVYEDLKQMAVNESVQREVNARESIKVKDIAYYYDLLKSGAITQDEYDKKKNELL